MPIFWGCADEKTQEGTGAATGQVFTLGSIARGGTQQSAQLKDSSDIPTMPDRLRKATPEKLQSVVVSAVVAATRAALDRVITAVNEGSGHKAAVPEAEVAIPEYGCFSSYHGTKFCTCQFPGHARN